MTKPRTEFIDFDSRKNPKTSFSCIKCQKDLKPGQKFRRVQTPSGEPFAIHPEDSHLVTGETEWHFIGYNCAKKLGLKWTHPPEASTEPVKVREPGRGSPEALQLLAQVAKASKDSQ